MRTSARLLAAALAAALLAAAVAHQCAAHDTPSHSGDPRCRTRRPRPHMPHGECTHLVHQYIAQHTQDLGGTPHDVNKLLFFLHVPRAAGKTYANCFLRTALPPSKRCAKSYDQLRLNVSMEDCQTLISHDDFSISQFFPEGAATITQLRRPVERIISSYEFAVDVAAKGVLHPERPRKNPKRRADFVGTLEVWPWSILIPWFKQDMADRMEKLRLQTLNDLTAWRAFTSPDNRTYYWNEVKNSSVWTLPDPEPVLNPYNNSLVMPLHEFVEHPIAEELLHNGAALQVLGLTNYSYWAGTEALRRCVRSNSIAREMLLTLATKRLKTMAHVGLTERLDESVLSLAADLGLGLDGAAYKYTSSSAFTYDDGAANDDDLLTFYSAIEGHRNLTVARREAAQRVKAIVEQQRDLKRELDELTPRLTALVDREAQWLEEQHALKAAAEAVDSGATDWEAQEGEGGREAQHGEADEEAQEGEAEGEAHEGEEAHHDGQTSETAAEEDAAEGMAEDAASGSEEVLDGDTQVSDEEGEAQADGEGEDGAAGSDDAAEGQGEAGAQEEEEEPEEEDEGLTDIDSPWAEEIVALDQEVLAKQERMKQLESELVSLQNSGLVVSADEATGRARQLIPDEHYLLPSETLGHAYVRCANAGKGRRERRKVYKHLRTPWGETFRFEAQSRQLIPEDVTARIHQLNALDEELWKAGHALLEKKLEEQRAAGLLQSFPPFASPQMATAEQQQSSKRRKLHSTGEVVREEGPQAHRPPVHDSGAELYANDRAAAAAAANDSEAANNSDSANDSAAAGDSEDTAGSTGATANDTEATAPEASTTSATADAMINASAQSAHDEL